MINMNEHFFEKLQHLIYYEWFLDIRAGGPTGYLANLLDGINCIDNNENPLILFNTDVKNPPALEEKLNGIHKIAHTLFYKNARGKSYYINHISQYQKKAHDNYIKFLKKPHEMYCKTELFEKINLNSTPTIHAHTVGDALKLKNSLRRVGRNDIKVMLTSHTPEAPSNEYFKSYLEQGHNKERAEEIRAGWKNIETLAFKESDILVFPSPEAMEPLLETIPDFRDIVKNKDIRFIPTGAKQLRSSLSREEAKKKYGVEGKFVVGYVGRHNEIKGYDILQEAAKKVLPLKSDMCFLIGGAQGNTFSPLPHERWIEAGWVNPADLFMALDVFVLPNRMTYYDLVLLEVMSMGVPIIASSTGGNKSVHTLTDSLVLYENSSDDLAEKILMIYNMEPQALETQRQKIQDAYSQYFTTIKFATRYKELINQIYADYHLL